MYLTVRKKRLLAAWNLYVEKVGTKLKSSIDNLKSAPNIKWICVNFSSIHKKAKTEFWMAATFMFWAAATTTHMLYNYRRDKDNLLQWVIEILVAAVFATGFGWHLNKLASLRRMEKRGKSTAHQKFRKILI